MALGALILAAMLTWTRSNFATMFTPRSPSTVLLAIVWSGVFILIYRFQPWHGFGLAMATLLIFAGMTTMVVDSMLSPQAAPAGSTRPRGHKPIRRARSGPAPPPARSPAKK